MVPIADAHSDFLGYYAQGSAGGRLYDQADLEGMKKGGIALQVFAVWVAAELKDTATCGRRQIAYFKKCLQENECDIVQCASVKDMGDSRIKAVLAIESGEGIGCCTDTIKDVYGDGARLMSLTWNDENAWASGCCAQGGLKYEGIEAVKELSRLCIALDMSHINEQGFWEAAQNYTHVPCATHSCVYELVHCPRNLKDDQIDYLIQNGGFIGINFYTEFLSGRYAEIDDILRHVEYILERGGEDCVGLGSDFCGIQYTPNGLKSVADYQKIPEAMRRRRYSETLISKICYGNFKDYILNFL